jgi:aspartyl-tRNA(Asn)/glutamyl-tRNA(Gln) amidotransferase subunit C
MRWTADDVRHVAALARLEVAGEEADRLADELTRILAYVDRLGDVPGEDGEPVGAAPRRADVPRAATPPPVRSDVPPVRGDAG